MAVEIVNGIVRRDVLRKERRSGFHRIIVCTAETFMKTAQLRRLSENKTNVKRVNR